MPLTSRPVEPLPEPALSRDELHAAFAVLTRISDCYHVDSAAFSTLTEAKRLIESECYVRNLPRPEH